MNFPFAKEMMSHNSKVMAIAKVFMGNINWKNKQIKLVNFEFRFLDAGWLIYRQRMKKKQNRGEKKSQLWYRQLVGFEIHHKFSEEKQFVSLNQYSTWKFLISTVMNVLSYRHAILKANNRQADHPNSPSTEWPFALLVRNLRS